MRKIKFTIMLKDKKLYKNKAVKEWLKKFTIELRRMVDNELMEKYKKWNKDNPIIFSGKALNHSEPSGFARKTKRGYQ